jgi:hypothetical protein
MPDQDDDKYKGPPNPDNSRFGATEDDIVLLGRITELRDLVAEREAAKKTEEAKKGAK